jgi:hypothetical protein
MPRASLETHPATIADAASVATLVAVVLERVEEDALTRLAEWSREQSNAAPVRWLDALAPTLFEHAEAEPIEFAESALGGPRLPPRVVTAAPLVATPTRAALALPDWAARYVPTAQSISRVRDALASVRPRLWIIAGGVAAALVAAVLFVPTGGSDAAPEPAASATLTTAPVGDARLTGDDPVPALLALLETRDRCIRDLSLLCLDAVAQPGSAALAHDQEVVRQLLEGGESAEGWRIEVVTLTESLGGSALLAVTGSGNSEPASVLLVKGEAGWRIRDYVWR